jgi:hypothetical protein
MLPVRKYCVNMAIRTIGAVLCRYAWSFTDWWCVVTPWRICANSNRVSAITASLTQNADWAQYGGREFVCLDYETVLNSLSAFEAGQVDQNIEKTRDSTGGEVAVRTQSQGLKAGIRNSDKDAIGAFDAWDR